ncbi:hypothetical protein NUW58_g518 [Xylaria curta]|uniref:Uncharacterized protein n=1 Tax=Xylaria curta TaxID=42375 RepID=A0ACC1PPG6_9PEZI|nr:hypothetical protein NUW58_g518 [Xylaria curta]
MSGAELPLAIIGTIDLAFKYGKRLVELCRALRDTENELAERTLRVEVGWLRTAKQLEFMQRDEGLMGADHKQINEKILEQLQSKLKAVTSKLESVVKMPNKDGDTNSTEESSGTGTPRRLKYALLKKSIDEAVEELEVWQRTVDPSWHLILKIASSQIDQALMSGNEGITTSFPSTSIIRPGLRGANSDESTKVFLPSSELKKMTIVDIPFCDAQLAMRQSARKGLQRFLLIKAACLPEANVNNIRRDLRDLARKLSHDSLRTFGLLSCKGVIEQTDTTIPDMQAPVTFTIVFITPTDLSDPRSLRDQLLSSGEGMALSDKFDIARQMATSVSYVHAFGFVHKDIRPETVVIFAEAQASSPPAVFLVGFGSFRKEEGMTYRIGDDNWEKNLYRHPSRQGSRPNNEYIMQHDIYSLGVCLLEVGLGKSFVSYDPEGRHPVSLPAIEAQGNNASLWESDALKNHLVGLARDELPRCMGPRYAAVVKTCLTCLDPDNTDFGDKQEFLDKDGVLVGVRYIEKVGFLSLITVGVVSEFLTGRNWWPEEIGVEKWEQRARTVRRVTKKDGTYRNPEAKKNVEVEEPDRQKDSNGNRL